MAWVTPTPEPKKTRRRAANMHVNKGKSGERELATKFVLMMEEVEQEFGLLGASGEVKRNLMQSMEGGFDIVGIPGLAVECKRCETVKVSAWWDQAVNQAPAGLMPVVIYRQNRKSWRVVSYVLLSAPPYKPQRWIVAEYGVDEFFAWYREIYADWLLTKAQDEA